MPNRTDCWYMHLLVPLSAACVAQSMGTDAFSVLWAAVSTVGTAVPPAVRFNLPTVGNGWPYVYSAASSQQSSRQSDRPDSRYPDRPDSRYRWRYNAPALFYRQSVWIPLTFSIFCVPTVGIMSY
jgi:hypothetical protein